MVVDVYFGPCSDPGSNPGVSTNMKSLVLIILAFLFVWLLLQAQKEQKKINRTKKRLVDKIRNRER